MGKKILSILLALAISIGLLPSVSIMAHAVEDATDLSDWVTDGCGEVPDKKLSINDEADFKQFQLQLAKCYDFGKGVPQDLHEAVRWYTQAAMGGNTNAQDNLGTCYVSGTGVEKDLDKAFYWYNQAAMAGNASAMNNLGLCYRNGEGTMKDDAKAAFCFQSAAVIGNANAQYNLGRCYYHGLGVQQDTEQAKTWVTKAAAQGHKNAQLFMEDNQWTQPQ